MPQWTDEQTQVIESRGQDLLVSAAAGSGKTAVLVQRIMEKILDVDRPADIDRLLVVTFTNAAAASLRLKIRARLEEEAAGEDPQKAKTALRQLSMLAGDHIETIDRFCREIVLDHADYLGIDPAFRIADDGERKLLQSEVVSQVIEESFEDPSEKNRKAFLDLSRLYAPGRTDEGLEELILQFYEFSVSHEFPKLWRHGCADLYRSGAGGQEWEKDLTDSLRMRFEEIYGSLEEGIGICRAEGGPYHYTQAMEDHAALLERLLRCGSMAECAVIMQDYSWKRPGVKKRSAGAPAVEEALEKYVKEIRERAGKALKKLAEQFFYAPEEEIDKMRLSTARFMDALVTLTDRFEERFAREKTERGIADFSDVAHWALRVLICVDDDGMPAVDENGNYVKTSFAAELADYYQEIYIDEYQDSNRVQEILLGSIARSGGRFMVGDMKQSIYRFRMADTGIFLEKAASYSGEAHAKQRRIDLHSNFRSRACVLDAVNLIFRQIMRRETGGVEYSEDQELRAGYVFPACTMKYIDESISVDHADDSEDEAAEPAGSDESTDNDMNGDASFLLPELILAEQGDVPGASSGAEAEAAVVAARILAMVGKMPLYNKETGEYAPAGYGDITILLRTAAGWAETFSRVLDEHGIPNRSDASTGYFDAPEVRTILAYLNVLDNPRQDIPLAASLRSVIGDLTDRELALIRAEAGKGSLYDIVRWYREQGQDAAVRRKLAGFLDMTKKLRACVRDTPIHILLWKIFDVTGYENRVSAMRGGRQKRANLALLVDMAMTFEQTSYRGLFHFVRYIEKIRKAEKDIGQAPEQAGAQNCVRIMTMHKSKGLEFPVVFVSGLSKGFNLQDSRGKLVLHEHLGAGLDYCDVRRRGRMPNRIKNAVAARIRTDSIGEELRVLYVAMTRAEQKLILTGCVNSTPKAVEAALFSRFHKKQKLPKGTIEGASCMLDWILSALARHDTARGFFDSGRWQGIRFRENEAAGLPGRIVIRTGREILADQNMQLKAEERRLEDLFAHSPYEVADPALHSRLAYLLDTAVARPAVPEQIPGKVSVSLIKHEAYAAEMNRLLAKEEGPDSCIMPEEMQAAEETLKPAILLPEFLKEEKEGPAHTAADRGTAYHQVLADIDFSGDRTKEQIAARLETMVKCDKIQKEEASGIDTGKIAAFLSSTLGERMRRSAGQKKLWREQPFVISRAARSIRPAWDSDEKILIQGIIDAFFIEEDEVVLVDYKTDHARPGDEESLVTRYREQFRLYADALQSLLQKRVKEAWLYSLSLNKAIRVDLPDASGIQ